MVRVVGVFVVFGAFWWLLAGALGGRLWHLMTDDPVAVVLWLLLALPFIMAACILIPERLRTARLVDEVPVEVHNHLHVHQHNQVTVNHTDASRHLHLHSGGTASREGLAWRAGRDLARSPERRQLESGQPRILPGTVVERAKRR